VYSLPEQESCFLENASVLSVSKIEVFFVCQGDCARTWSWSSLWARDVLGWTAIPAVDQWKRWCVGLAFLQLNCGRTRRVGVFVF